jgi:hypothetical protein
VSTAASSSTRYTDRHIGLRWRLSELQNDLKEVIRAREKPSDAQREQLQAFRKMLGLGCEEIGNRIRKSGRTIQYLEDGFSSNPAALQDYVSTLIEIVDSICVRPGQLLRWLNPPLPPSWSNRSPRALLDPERRIIPLHGNGYQDQLQDLVHWCDSGHKVQIRSIKGDAGMGKTRLGVELCRRLLAGQRGDDGPGWMAGFLNPDEFSGPWGDADLRERDLLIVIDYAGTPKPLAALKELVPHLVDPPLRRVRLLLLDRTDFWLSQLERTAGYADLKTRYGITRQLSPVGSAYTGTDRKTIFETAREQFRQALNVAKNSAKPPDLDQPDFDRVLLLHMAALLSAGSPQSLPHTEADILDLILERERRQWDRRMEVWSVPPGLFPIVERAAWNITLNQGARTEADAMAVAGQDPAFKSLPYHMQQAVLYVLRDCHSSSEAYIEPLRPDRLGEFFLAKGPGGDRP